MEQKYVALSRCKTLEGMVLASQIPPQAIINDERVDDYIEHQEEAAQHSIEQLPTLKDEVLAKPLALVSDVKSQNKLAMKRLTENHAELQQAWLSRRFLLQQMSQKTFTIADYLRQKQHSLLNAMDTDDPKRNGGKGSTKGRKKDRKK